MTDIPKWANDKAWSLSCDAPTRRPGTLPAADDVLAAFALYVAAHEEAPVDPALTDCIQAAWGWNSDNAKARAEELAAQFKARGMELAQLTNQDSHHD